MSGLHGQLVSSLSAFETSPGYFCSIWNLECSPAAARHVVQWLEQHASAWAPRHGFVQIQFKQVVILNADHLPVPIVDHG